MKIDFSVLEKYEKVAVACKEEWQAELFVYELRKQHPEIDSDDFVDSAHWDLYEEHTCYAPHINSKITTWLQYSPDYYWSKEGYTIVPFDMLTYENVDLGVFDPEDVHTLF